MDSRTAVAFDSGSGLKQTISASRKRADDSQYQVLSLNRKRITILAAAGLFSLALYLGFRSCILRSTALISTLWDEYANVESDVCPQAQPLYPVKHVDVEDKLASVFADETYKLNAYDALGGAVRIPTESYDDLRPVGEDDRWDVFGELHAYLEKTFPTVFDRLTVTKVNTYGIVLHWQGADESLLPVLIAAHQDVVPVDPATVNEWVHPPYSGFYDGTWIWGRGAADDKSGLIASLQAVDALLEQGFQPQRTFVFAYGFDEEASGTQGAGHLAVYLEQKYGTNGFALLLDEGGGYGTPFGDSVIFATPNLVEKGYLDVRIEVTAKGGHSSVPPEHTAIGILSSLIVAVESSPHEPTLLRGGTSYNTTLCAAMYGPDFPPHLRTLAFKATTSDRALAQLKDALLAAFPVYDALLRTTQAVDLVHGGVKVNALPERASAVVNHRIAEHSSVRDLQARLTGVVLPVAERLDLSVDAFGREVRRAGSGEGAGRVVLSDAFDSALEPSPVTPGGKERPFGVLGGTIRAAIGSAGRRGGAGGGVVVVPVLALGNTDTQFYWNLTRHIFRYSHLDERDVYGGLHTVNEAVRAEGWMESICFYTKFILNCDEYL